MGTASACLVDFSAFEVAYECDDGPNKGKHRDLMFYVRERLLGRLSIFSAPSPLTMVAPSLPAACEPSPSLNMMDARIATADVDGGRCARTCVVGGFSALLPPLRPLSHFLVAQILVLILMDWLEYLDRIGLL